MRDLQEGAAANREYLQGWQRLQTEMGQTRPATEGLLSELRSLQVEVSVSLTEARTERSETAGWLGTERVGISEWLSTERNALVGQVEAGQLRLEEAHKAAAQLVADADTEASRLVTSAQAGASAIILEARRDAGGVRQAAQAESEQTLAAVREERRLMHEERTRYHEELSRILLAASDSQTEAVRLQGQEFSAQIRTLSARVSSFTDWFRGASIFERLRQAPPLDDQHA